MVIIVTRARATLIRWATQTKFGACMMDRTTKRFAREHSNTHAMKTKQLPEVNTRNYEFAHGKRPRGIGSWAFATSPDAPIGEKFFAADEVLGVRQTTLTYTRAKRIAREHFRGHATIYVLS